MKPRHTAAVALVALAVGTTAHAADGAVGPGAAEHATAELVDPSGARVGIARFTEDAAGRLHVNVKVAGLTPGRHGIHIHAVGACSPDFGAAGPHHNPTGAPHGDHAGDLPNLVVNGQGHGRLNTTTDAATLSAGPVTVFDGNGSAVIIHAAEDDFVTQPTGNSGARVACGVIVPG